MDTHIPALGVGKVAVQRRRGFVGEATAEAGHQVGALVRKGVADNCWQTLLLVTIKTCSVISQTVPVTISAPNFEILGGEVVIRGDVTVVNVSDVEHEVNALAGIDLVGNGVDKKWRVLTLVLELTVV